MFVHSVTIVTNDWPGVKCQPAPPTSLFPARGPTYAYTTQVCSERVCVLSMNRPADKRNDYTDMFIFKCDFYLRIISTQQVCMIMFCKGLHAAFTNLWWSESLNSFSAHCRATCFACPNACLHMLTHGKQSSHLASPLIYIFRDIFHHKCVLSAIFAGELRVCIAAGLSRTRNLWWKPGSNRRNPGNVLPTKWVPFPWKSCAELGI